MKKHRKSSPEIEDREQEISPVDQKKAISLGGKLGEIECKLISGKSITGLLERPFYPAEGEVVIRSEGKIHAYPLDQVSCILFTKAPDEHYQPYMPGEIAETIETRGKEVYSVRVLQQQLMDDDTVKGFYGIPSSPENNISRIFFPKTGILSRCEQRRIGEILEVNGNVPQITIQDALNEQKQLRNRRIGEIFEERKIISKEKIDEALSEQDELQDRRIGEIIAEKHNISQDEIDEAVSKEKKQAKFMYVRIGEILISNGLITKEQLDDAIKEQKSNKKMQLGEILIKRNIITEDELMMSLALKFRLRFVDLRDISPNQETMDMIPIDLVRKFRIFPISFDGSKITIATYQLNDISCLDSVRIHTCQWVERVVAKSTQIEAYIDKYFEIQNDDINIEIEAVMSEMEIEDQTESLSLKSEAETAPIVRLSGKILMDAVEEGASDIHVLPQENDLKVSFRVNGLLQQYLTLDKRLSKSLIARFKLVALMNIAEHRQPQDGRIRVKLKNRNIEFRVSCMPGLYGENLVLRVLDKSNETISLEKLGIDLKDVKSINHIVRSSYGMLLVTGPTGSGKSTTLASILHSLVDVPKHKISLEDPIETEVPGVNQMQIHDKIGFTFSSALRNVLRHDPDIIMVGEIRDPETAKIAVQASLTGHVLLSTLHTTKAVAAFSRLVDMGVESYLISATIKGVMAQQLLPRLCEKCRSTSEPTSKVLDYLAKNEIETKNLVSYVSTGCEHCRNSGVSGRLLLYELLCVNREMQRLITQMAPVETLQEVASKSGMRSMVSMALEVSQKGLISLDRIIPLLIE